MYVCIYSYLNERMVLWKILLSHSRDVPTRDWDLYFREYWKNPVFFFTVDSKFQNFSVPRWNQRWLFGNEVTLGQKRILIWKNSIVWRPIGSRDKRGKPVSPTRRDRYLNDWWQSGGRFCFLKFSPNYKRPCDDVLDSRSSFNDPPWEINFVIIITNLIGRPRATYFYSLVRRAPM